MPEAVIDQEGDFIIFVDNDKLNAHEETLS